MLSLFFILCSHINKIRLKEKLKMKISIEISMYPFSENFGEPILNFIKKIKSYPNISTKTNSMSTQIFGDYDDVMNLLKKEIKPVFEDKLKTVMVMKIINADLDYNFE